MEHGQNNGGVTSWSAHHIPAGSSVRYVLDAVHDDVPVRLVIGDLEQVELEMSLPEVTSIIATLQEAEREIRARRGEVANGRR